MNLQIILIIIGFALIFILAFRLLKGVIKAVISLLIIAILLVCVFGIIIYTDTVNLKKGFEGEKTILITQEQLLITAFSINSNATMSSTIKQDFYQPLTPEEIEELFEKIENEKYEEIEEKGLLLVIEQEVFYEEETTIFEKTIKFNKETLDKFALTTSTIDALQILKEKEIITEQELLALSTQDIHNIKSRIYYALFAKKIKETKGNFIVEELKNQKIMIRPELISIKLLDYFPEKIIQQITKLEE